jgi:hypothetical protein
LAWCDLKPCELANPSRLSYELCKARIRFVAYRTESKGAFAITETDLSSVAGPTDRDRLLEVARAVDSADTESVTHLLNATWAGAMSSQERRLLTNLWRLHLVRKHVKPRDGFETMPRLDAFFDAIEAAQQKDAFWRVLEAFPSVEAILGERLAIKIASDALWGQLATAPYWVQYEFLSRCFVGGDIAAMPALMEKLLVEDRTFIPDYWLFQSLIRCWYDLGSTDPDREVETLLARTGRAELSTLFTVYLRLAGQTEADIGYALARQLHDPVHRAHIAAYLLGASQTEETICAARDLHDAMAPSDHFNQRLFMESRVAVAEERWADGLKATQHLVQVQDLKNEAICLRALCLAQTGDFDNAVGAANHVRYNPRAPWFLRGRAALINVSTRMLSEGLEVPGKMAAPALRPGQGRPMAQSLWIGPRLRWIELLSMASYLSNGWRYKLYVYEAPENVPEGVELADANAVLPASAFFTEGSRSGMHKGSVGAFSDLFRYALLSRIGGMWTDTDVINLRLFEPENARFISTERTDAGLIGLNGAMMAAPPGDALQQSAFEITTERLAAGLSHFGKVGPELLAELIGDGGLQGYTLLPTDFLNPIGWMETGQLLRPTREVLARKLFERAHNIHVYTETWRILGLSLATPPQREGFLTDLYRRLVQDGARDRSIAELLAG